MLSFDILSSEERNFDVFTSCRSIVSNSRLSIDGLVLSFHNKAPISVVIVAVGRVGGVLFDE